MFFASSIRRVISWTATVQGKTSIFVFFVFLSLILLASAIIPNYFGCFFLRENYDSINQIDKICAVNFMARTKMHECVDHNENAPFTDVITWRHILGHIVFFPSFSMSSSNSEKTQCDASFCPSLINRMQFINKLERCRKISNVLHRIVCTFCTYRPDYRLLVFARFNCVQIRFCHWHWLTFVNWIVCFFFCVTISFRRNMQFYFLNVYLCARNFIDKLSVSIAKHRIMKMEMWYFCICHSTSGSW